MAEYHLFEMVFISIRLNAFTVVYSIKVLVMFEMLEEVFFFL